MAGVLIRAMIRGVFGNMVHTTFGNALHGVFSTNAAIVLMIVNAYGGARASRLRKCGDIRETGNMTPVWFIWVAIVAVWATLVVLIVARTVVRMISATRRLLRRP